MVLSHRELVGIGQQSTLGTPVAATHLLPVTSFRISEQFEQIRDNGRRGFDSMDYRAIQGVKYFEITIEGMIQGHGSLGMPFGILMRNLLGSGIEAGAYPAPAQIGVTGVYKHYRYLGTTKEYLTIEHDSQLSGTNVRQIEGCRVREIGLSWNAGEGVVTYTATLVGRELALIAGADLSAQSDDSEDSFAGWRGVINVNGVDNFARMISAEWTLTRSENRIYTAQNQQVYNEILTGPLEVTSNLVFDFTVNTDIQMFRDKSQGELINIFEYGSSGSLRGFGIASVLTDFGDGPAEVDSSGDNLTLGLTARCLHSTSDGPISTDKADTHAQNGPVETLTEELAIARY